MRTGIQIIIRLPPPLLARLNAEIAKTDPERPWLKRSKNQYVIEALDGVLPQVNGGASKASNGQLDIEEHIARKAKVRNLRRARAFAVAALRAAKVAKRKVKRAKATRRQKGGRK